jgi:hypothetical protein
MTSFLPGTNKDYVNAYNNWWFNGAQGPAPDRGKFGPDTNEYKKGKWTNDVSEDMGKGSTAGGNKWLDLYRESYKRSQQQKIGGGEVTRGLRGNGFAPGYGGSIGKGGQIRTTDIQDKDGDGVDDRDQRRPGGSHWYEDKGKGKDSWATSDWWYNSGQPNKGGFGPQGGRPATPPNRPAKTLLQGGRPATPPNRPAKSQINNPAGRPSSKTDWLSYGNQVVNDATSGKTEKPNFGDYQPGSFGGNLYNQGWGNMVDWGNKFKDNETIQAGVSGARMDSNRTMMNMGLNLLYQKGQMSNLAEYQGGMENLRTGNTMKLMAAEGGIVQQLNEGLGKIESRHIGEKGDQERRSLRVAGQEDRAGIMTQGDQDRRGTRVKGKEDRMGMMEKGSQDRMGMAAQGLEDRALTRTKGDQERKTQRDKYREERKMRSDARGAVRRSGASFFG